MRGRRDLEIEPKTEKSEPAVGAFVPYPAFVITGLSWRQLWWQQQMYQRAWAMIYGPHQVKVRLADLPRVMRN